MTKTYNLILGLSFYLLFFANDVYCHNTSYVVADKLTVNDSDPTTTIINTSAICLSNATNFQNGQFLQSLKIKSRSNETWSIFEATNFYSVLSDAPPSIPIHFQNDTLNEVQVTPLLSEYTIDGIFESGKYFVVTLKSNNDEYIRIYGGGLKYESIIISGKNKICPAETTHYNIVSEGSFSILINEGTLINANSDTTSFDVLWSSNIGIGTIKVIQKDGTQCTAPLLYKVAIGNNDVAMACKVNTTINIGNECSKEITPALILAQPSQINDPYIIELYDQHNNWINSSTISGQDIGKTLKVKVSNGCFGNSCWGNLFISDESKPELHCIEQIDINCWDVDNVFTPVAEDNCNILNNVSLVDSITVRLECDSNFIYTINKTYRAEDATGNKSNSCLQKINIKKINLDEIDFPLDVTMVNPLTCKNYEVDDNGYPSPTSTGAPAIGTCNLLTQNFMVCNIVTTYKDIDLGYIGCVRKLMREWTVIEWWCNQGIVKRDTQLIHITDLQAPDFTCIDSIFASANLQECEAMILIPSIDSIQDDCSSKFEIDLLYPGGFLNNSNGGSIQLPVGIHEIHYVVYDECLNSGTCTTIVTVADKTPPIAVCKNNITVSINSNGEAYLPAIAIDNGSYDKCYFDDIKGRRIDFDSTCSASNEYDDLLKFCCNDVSKSIMVELRVKDAFNNYNSCMTFVNVQDKLPPQIICPEDITISCLTNYDLNNLDQYGTASMLDNCETTIEEHAKEVVNQCRVGHIERIFKAGKIDTFTQCTSYIYIVKDSPAFSIKWPLDYTIEGSCDQQDIHPDSLAQEYGRPYIVEGICDLVGSAYTDNEFHFNDGNGSCYKIIRRWTVLDYCQMSAPNYRPIEYEQIIKVINKIAPTLTVDVDTVVCSQEGNCESGFIKLKAMGEDDCTDENELFWEYKIDYNYKELFAADTIVKGKGSTIDASGQIIYGHHRILFTFEDRCGNVKSTFHDFIIKNCKNPTVVCKDAVGLALNLMTIDGIPQRMACIKASSLNQSSSSACGSKLKFSFSSNENDSIKCFTCENIGLNSISLFATDELGNQSLCKSTVEVMNNDGMSLRIEGPESICIGNSTTLTAVTAPGVSILWNTGATTPSITVSPNTTTTYSVVANSNDGCRMAAQLELVVHPNQITISGNSEICSGTTATLTAPTALSYLWSNAATTASITISPNVSTEYTVTVTSSNGCTATGSKSIVVNPLPQFDLTGLSPVCEEENSILNVINAPQNVKYFWSNIATSPSIVVTPTINNNFYSVTVTSDKGCQNAKSITITLNPKPVASITGDNNICAGEITTLTASGGGTYFWNIDNIKNPIIFVKPTTNAVYAVTVTNSFGCKDVESIFITVNPLPIPVINGNTTICLGESTELTAQGAGPGGSYLWSQGSNTTIITVNPTANTTYTVTVTTSQGCIATKSVEVLVNNCLTNTSQLNGFIKTMDGKPISGIKFSLSEDEVYQISDENGYFSFDNLETGGNYSIKSASNKDILEGISTLDLILIQRHILGIEKIQNPYLYIAADVNKDGKISAQDLVELRKVILGINDEFKNNTSWIGLESNYQFPDINNPLNANIPFECDVFNLRGIKEMNFVGIKIGDVTNKGNKYTQNQLTTDLLIEESTQFENTYEFSLKEPNIFSGGQIELALPFSEVIEVSSNVISADDIKYSFKNGILTIILTPKNSMSLNNDVLFSVKLGYENPSIKNNGMDIAKSRLNSEFYINNEIRAVNVKFEGNAINEFIHYAYPNPTANGISINFVKLSQSSIVHLKLFNELGMLIFENSAANSIESSSFNIQSDLTKNNGVYFYELIIDSKSYYGKFIKAN